MSNREFEPRLWTTAAILGGIATVLAIVLIVVAIDSVPIKLLAGVAALGAVAVTGLALSEAQAARGRGPRPDVGRRWASLLIGGTAAIVAAVSVPWFGEFTAPLGEASVRGVQIAGVLVALLFAALAWWGFTRRG